MTKGKRRERQAAELYQEAGYETYRPQESKYGETDMFGLFDMVAVGPVRSYWVQVKSNRAEGIEAFCEDTSWLQELELHGVVMLVCYDNEGWRLIAPRGPDSHRTLVDERDMDVNMGEGLVAYLEE